MGQRIGGLHEVGTKRVVKKANVQEKLELIAYVGLWLKRKQTLLWIKWWKLGDDVNELRLRCACARHKLKSQEEYDKKKLKEDIEATLLARRVGKVTPKL